MSLMEGFLLVPPERGTIIGRAAWKPRYVVLGNGLHLKAQTDIIAQAEQKISRKGLKTTSSRPSLVDLNQNDGDELHISVFKQKGDFEHLAQHPISAFKTCEIRHVQHRKQGPTLPTLMLEFKADTPSEKQRKRRSSRTAALTSKDPYASVLLLRSIAEEKYNIYDWQSAIGPQLTPETEPLETPEDEIQSPFSPGLSSFMNPFSRDTKSNTRPEYQRGASNTSVVSHAQGSRERPSAMISPAPSLRSRRSDLSSQGSSLHPPMGFSSAHPQKYTQALPSDLPSPASTSGYEDQFIEGWTSAQGRSSALSSHTRGSNSIASAVVPGMVDAAPPGPRETILDRAFQMRYIPGSERVQDKDEEKVSSIARFEALMREADERKRQRNASFSKPEKSGWELDEESEEDSEDDLRDDEDDAMPEMLDQDILIPTPAKRALDYISGRRAPPPSNSSRPLSPPPRSPSVPFLNPQAMSAFHRRPTQETSSQRPRTGASSRPQSLALPSRSISAAAVPSLKELRESAGSLQPGGSDKDPRESLKRSSSASAKRLSFTEFAKRLSSTSSLLLVQTNASSSEGGADEEGEEGAAAGGLRMDKRCGWRGSVGVFGGEGGFL